MRSGVLPEATRERITAAIQTIFVTVGAVTVSIGIAGLLDLVAIDSGTSLFIVALGTVWVLGGIFKADLMEFILRS